MAEALRAGISPDSGRVRAFISRYITENEGSVEYPYLDSKGLVTIGAGFKADDEASFVKLPLYERGTDRRLTDAEKRAAFAAMQAERRRRDGRFNVTPDRYEYTTIAELRESDINRRLEEELRTRIPKVAREIGAEAWQRLTDREKAIAVDVHYAVGNLGSFGKLTDALRRVPADEADAARRREEIARESVFFSGRDADDKKVRNWRRIEANYCGALGMSGAACHEALRQHFPRDAPEEKPPNWLWPEQKDGRPQRQGERPSPETDRMLAQIRQTGETLDEVMRKPAEVVTEAEIDRVIAEKTAMPSHDPRRPSAERAVAAWFQRQFGNEVAGGPNATKGAGTPVRLHPARDAAGRPVEEGVLAVGRAVADSATTTEWKRLSPAFRRC